MFGTLLCSAEPEAGDRNRRDETIGSVALLEEGGGAEEESEVLGRALASAVLVLLGGVFAGLTIGLMGQDEVYLQVTAETGDENERRCAARVLQLLAKGKHWVLVTLLLSNVITNETLPIVLDRLLGGGWPAVVSSTAAIVVFGEIIPQSICVRYGLPLGAFFAPFVQALMYIMYPIAVPIAKLLDHVLGEDHGTIYKKAGLKSLVTLHHHMGIERLNEDEVTIISAVLDLKDKPVSHIMTPINDVFVLSSDTVLDEKMVEKILLTGFNRIPIHVPGEPLNFVGMLLVRTLITYDPDDALPISSFSLATLPETAPDTSCLNILNYFQEGKAHMVAVSNDPGAVTGAVGVVTLEDVIEELIGEEIVDESDVYVDVHRAIRRVTPAPMFQSTMKTAAKATQIANQQKITTLRPSNRASDPKVTQNSKITIKRGGGARDSSPGGSRHRYSKSLSPSISHMPPFRDEEEDAPAPPGPSMLSPSGTRRHRQDGDEEADADADGAAHYPSLSVLARSPGNIVTKVNAGELEGGPSVDVAHTERDAIDRNLGPHGLHSAQSRYATSSAASASASASAPASDAASPRRAEPAAGSGSGAKSSSNSNIDNANSSISIRNSNSNSNLNSSSSGGASGRSDDGVAANTPKRSLRSPKDGSPDEDENRPATFSENLVRVNGVNKVVIQEISSSSDEDRDPEDASVHSGSNKKKSKKKNGRNGKRWSKASLK